MVRKRLLTLFLAAASAGAICAPTARCEVLRQDNSFIGHQLKMPVYQWSDSATTPKALVLAIHGLAMHGTVYDVCARDLAADNCIVMAPDLRGYGRWHETHPKKAAQYEQSERDLAALAQAMRSKYPGVPLIVVGESLGGSLAIRLAAKHPDIVDGLILSAPAVKHHHPMPLRTALDTAIALADPMHKIDVSPLLTNYFSNEPAIAKEEIDDPLVRKEFSLGELMASCRIIAATADSIKKLPNDMPVLVLQGSKDRMIKRASINMLRRHSHAVSVHVLPGHGHILLETAHIDSETMHTVRDWLDGNCHMRTIEGAKVAGGTHIEAHAVD